MKSKKEPVKVSSVWACYCDTSKSMNFDEICAHCCEEHGLMIRGKNAKRSMVMHLDCEDSYHSTYEVEVEGIKLTNSTTNPRNKSDMMYGD